MYSVCLADSDPDLVAGSPELAAETIAVLSVPPGEWSVEDGRLSAERAPGGLLVLEGLLSRDVRVGGRFVPELLGPTDTLRPWVRMGADSSLGVEASWTAHEGAMVGLLDPSFMRTAAEYPQVMSVLMDRLVLRARWLVLQLAICSLRGVDKRLLMTFWHLADRWGSVTADGVKLPLPLTHDLLARMVGARRPTVSTALTHLREQADVERCADGYWLLRGDAPADLRRLEERTAGVAG